MRYRYLAICGFRFCAQTILFFSIYVIMPFATATGVYRINEPSTDNRQWPNRAIRYPNRWNAMNTAKLETCV